MSTPEANKAMVRRLVGAINAGEEAEAVEEMFAPRAARRVKRLFAEFRAAFPDWQEEIVQLVAEEDAVAGRFRCSGTHRGEFLGEAPTGKRMDVEEVFFVRVEDGKFVDFWGLEDSLGRLRQLGLIPPAAELPRTPYTRSSQNPPSRNCLEKRAG
jgi:predicted ester cyclase